MALLNQSVQVYGQIGKVLEALRGGQAPEKFNRQFLKDMGFKSSNHLQLIPLLKGLKFLSPEGTPTDRYKSFLDPTRWKKILGESVREAYGDIFVLKAKPTTADRQMIAGKYKSTYNLSDIAADRAARTFLALLELSDPDTVYDTVTPATTVDTNGDDEASEQKPPPGGANPTDSKPIAIPSIGLHYNIQSF